VLRKYHFVSVNGKGIHCLTSGQVWGERERAASKPTYGFRGAVKGFGQLHPHGEAGAGLRGPLRDQRPLSVRDAEGEAGPLLLAVSLTRFDP